MVNITTEEFKEFLKILNNSYLIVITMRLVLSAIVLFDKQEQEDQEKSKKAQIANGTYKNKISINKILILVFYLISLYYYFH